MSCQSLSSKSGAMAVPSALPDLTKMDTVRKLKSFAGSAASPRWNFQPWSRQVGRRWAVVGWARRARATASGQNSMEDGGWMAVFKSMRLIVEKCIHSYGGLAGVVEGAEPVCLPVIVCFRLPVEDAQSFSAGDGLDLTNKVGDKRLAGRGFVLGHTYFADHHGFVVTRHHVLHVSGA